MNIEEQNRLEAKNERLESEVKSISILAGTFLITTIISVTAMLLMMQGII